MGATLTGPIHLADAIAAQKKKLRQELRSRGPFDPASARRLQERVLESGLMSRASCVALYRALPSEPDTSLLEAHLAARSVRVCFPRTSEHEGSLTFYALAPANRSPSSDDAVARELIPASSEGPGAVRAGFQRGRLGVEEPETPETSFASQLIPLEQIDLFVVPALAADLRGNRLGRGRGHYDQTLLLQTRALRIGLVRDAALVDQLPAAEHDAPLDALCSEARLILCSARARDAAQQRASSAGDIST